MASNLTLHEQILLLSIWRLHDDAYGVAIRQNVMDVTNRTLHYGTLYNSLDKLVKKGLVSTLLGEPTSERGGRRKIYYSLTQEGLTSMQKAKELKASMWEGIPDFVR